MFKVFLHGGVDNRSMKTLGICLNILCHPPVNTLCDETPGFPVTTLFGPFDLITEDEHV